MKSDPLWKEINNLIWDWLVDNGLDKKVLATEADYLTDRIRKAIAEFESKYNPPSSFP
ncbi:MAG: hypothetical protein ACE14T_04615 [Syntrophales bacterium]